MKGGLEFCLSGTLSDVRRSFHVVRKAGDDCAIGSPENCLHRVEFICGWQGVSSPAFRVQAESRAGKFNLFIAGISRFYSL
jgi:hypothetical protein